MSNKNNTPEQKAAWLANHSLGSRKIKFIASSDYFPKPKEPSRRDLHRQAVVLATLAPAPLARPNPAIGCPPFQAKRSIEALARLSRRLPRLKTRCMRKLTHKANTDGSAYLTPLQFAYYRDKIAAVAEAGKLLAHELLFRNIGQEPHRDAMTFRLRRSLAHTIANRQLTTA